MWEILKASGVDPTRRSGPTWAQFLRSPAEAILACDFSTAGLPDGTQAYVLITWSHDVEQVFGAHKQGRPEENDVNLARPRRRPVQRSDATRPSRCIVALLAG